MGGVVGRDGGREPGEPEGGEAMWGCILLWFYSLKTAVTKLRTSEFSTDQERADLLLHSGAQSW